MGLRKGKIIHQTTRIIRTVTYKFNLYVVMMMKKNSFALLFNLNLLYRINLLNVLYVVHDFVIFNILINKKYSKISVLLELLFEVCACMMVHEKEFILNNYDLY